jgi:hypothetical protein
MGKIQEAEIGRWGWVEKRGTFGDCIIEWR